MQYHLYYHDDFDGMASGAVMLNFLRSRGDNIVSYKPIDYTPDLNEKWPKYNFKKPFILADFRYHPGADWWFDHHETSFNKPAPKNWRKLYKKDKTHASDSKYKSCCTLVLNHIIKHFGYKPDKYIVELAKWADRLDFADYKSAGWAMESREPAMKLRIYLMYEKNDCKRLQLLKDLASGSMKKIVNRGYIARKVKNGFSDLNKAIKNLGKISYSSGKIAFADATKTSSDISHYMLYYKYPKAKYSLVLETIKGGYHLGVGFNKWQKDKFCSDISKILSEYGGGGHRNVGAVEKRSKKEIMKIAEEIIEYLNKHG